MTGIRGGWGQNDCDGNNDEDRRSPTGFERLGEVRALIRALKTL